MERKNFRTICRDDKRALTPFNQTSFVIEKNMLSISLKKGHYLNDSMQLNQLVSHLLT